VYIDLARIGLQAARNRNKERVRSVILRATNRDENPCSPSGEPPRRRRRMMRDAAVPSRPLNARIIIGFGTALAILVAIGADSYRCAVGLSRSSRRVSHTHEVLSTLSALYADVLSVTSSRRAPPGSVRKGP
jgi:hypothetical protein